MRWGIGARGRTWGACVAAVRVVRSGWCSGAFVWFVATLSTMVDGSTPADVDLTPEERADIDGMYLRLASGTLYDLLGVSPTADRKAIRDAYFAISQRFHPDAFFGRNLGPWKERIEEIFREATRAYEILGNRHRRAEYDASIGIVSKGSVAPTVAAPAEASGAVPSRSSEVSATHGAVLSSSASGASTSEPPLQRSSVVSVAASGSASSIPSSTSVSVAAGGSVSPPVISREAAQRAAREALARKFRYASLGHAGTRSNESPSSVSSNRDDGAGSSSKGSEGVNPLVSLNVIREVRTEAERKARVMQLVRAADESLARDDLLGASNALTLASTLAPEDSALRARAEDIARRLAQRQADKYMQEAREHERQGDWDQAAVCWQKAVVGRPDDPVVHERAAHALLKAGKDLPRAAELARRAIQLDPKRADFHVTLAQIFLAGGLRASARGALEQASRLDPGSAIVKDLLTKVKG